MSFHHHQLENGIRIVHKKTTGAVAHCGLIIKGGSRDETEQEQGLAHFIEHVIFKGTSKRKAYHILSRMEDVGGELNAFTTKEETCIYSSFMPEYYSRALELLSDITFNSIFPKKELEKEKIVVLDEINYYKDNPSELIFDEFEEQVFSNHSLGKNILGTPKHIQSFDKKMIEDFMHKNYLTQEIIISSVGNISMSKLIKVIENHFANIPKKDLKREENTFSNYRKKEIEVERKGFQSHCILGTEAYGVNHPKKTALILLNNILGGPGMNSRLNLAIREKYGFTYSIESNYTSYSDTGIFSIYLASDNDKMNKSIKLAKRELIKFCEKPLGTLQLKKAKQQLIGQIAIGQESEVNLMLAMGKSMLLYNKVDTFELVKNKIENVTSEELVNVANEVFNLDNLSSLIYKV
jgi:predicted Zn-dependent peptidase|tara:strand:- start:336 stop:1559 length:1224 start_codon:yes stop_codon:yes gene_type:complete